MDALSVRHPARRVVVMAGSQIGKTEFANNFVLYVPKFAPGPMLCVAPRAEDAESWSVERIAPSIAASPEIDAVFSQNRSRQGDNKILYKKFPGGFIAFTGANSAAALRRRPIRYLVVDELDAFPDNVDGEGSPLSLAEKRMTNFPTRSKELIISTPTVKDHSAIETEYLLGDQRHYHVPCPSCGVFDWIRWQAIDYHDDPANPYWVCQHCNERIEERHKTWMFDPTNGAHWVADSVSRNGSLSYHLSALYSPLGWCSWAKIVQEHLESANDVPKRTTWVNTRLAETWRDENEEIDENALLARAKERYGADVPAGVGVLVAAVDVQADRLEFKVKGYGAGEESWLIAYGAIPCANPEEDGPWLQLDQNVLQQTWEHVSGQRMRIKCVVVDSNYKANTVYKFCRARVARRVYAIRGGQSYGQPLVGRPTANNAYNARLYTLCVNTGKDTVASRLRRTSPGPGYIHLPETVDKEYVDQLTAERCFPKFVKGKGYRRVWSKIRDRNEAWDLEVYCLAALKILGEPFIRTLGGRAARLAVPVLPLEAPPEGDTEMVSPADADAAAAPAAEVSGPADDADDGLPSPEADSPAPPRHNPAPPRPRKNWVTGGRRWRIR